MPISDITRRFTQRRASKGADPIRYTEEELSRLAFELDNKFVEIKKELEALGKLPTQADLEALQASLEVIEAQIAALQLVDFSTFIANTNNSLATLSSQIASLQSQVSTLFSLIPAARLSQTELISSGTVLAAFTEQLVYFDLTTAITAAVPEITCSVLSAGSVLPPEIVFAGCGYDSTNLRIYAKFHNRGSTSAVWPDCSITIFYSA
jgi:hypothetical protein